MPEFLRSHLSSYLRQDHDHRFASERGFAVLIGADRRKRNYRFVFANVRDRRRSCDRVAEENGCRELHRLRKIHGLSLAKLIAEHRRDKCTAQHAVSDTLAKLRFRGKLFVKMYPCIGHFLEKVEPFFTGRLQGTLHLNNIYARQVDGCFHAASAAGTTEYRLRNSGSEALTIDSLRSLATNNVTLILDVPLVADGVAAFDRLVGTARQLERGLGGKLVDAQGAAVADELILGIRTKIGELQRLMTSAGIDPGGPLAAKLFN